MELAAADVDPHVGWAGHQKGIAREPETGDVKDSRLLLVGDRYVDVFQRDDVAEVFGGSIESTLHESLHPRIRPAVSAGSRGSRDYNICARKRYSPPRPRDRRCLAS